MQAFNWRIQEVHEPFDLGLAGVHAVRFTQRKQIIEAVAYFALERPRAILENTLHKPDDGLLVNSMCRLDKLERFLEEAQRGAVLVARGPESKNANSPGHDQPLHVE